MWECPQCKTHYPIIFKKAGNCSGCDKKKRLAETPVLTEPSAKQPKPELKSEKSIMTDHTLFPRCEFYTRYEGTSYFAMPDHAFWNTYFRSKESRHGKMKVHYQSELHSKKDTLSDKQQYAFHTHAGSYKNPFAHRLYSSKIRIRPTQKYPKAQPGLLREQSLIYEYEICRPVVKKFYQLFQNIQPDTKLTSYKHAIVYVENAYPCVMVAMPWIQKNSTYPVPPSCSYWLTHPSEFQKLMMAYYVALTNYLADEARLPIEIVMRASFGHFSPSVAETGQCFRINVGIVPIEYTDILARGLIELYKIMFKFIYSTEHRTFPAAKYQAQLQKYNRSRGTNIQWSGTYWDVLAQKANSKHSVLYEILREQAALELLADFILDDLYRNKGIVAEAPIIKMFDYFSLKKQGEKYKMSFFDKIIPEIHKKRNSKRRWLAYDPSRPDALAVDPYFLLTINNICAALGCNRPYQEHAPLRPQLSNLYAIMEQRNSNFLQRCGYDLTDEKSLDSSGSESEGEVPAIIKNKIFFKKTVVNTGMLAISLAYHVAQFYLRLIGAKTFAVKGNYMYQETMKNLLNTKVLEGLERKIDQAATILFFDLTHCNTTNPPIMTPETASASLAAEIEKYRPSVLVLDFTSSTSSRMSEIFETVFSPELYDVDADDEGMLYPVYTEMYDLVLLVSSGLKHEGAGFDINPYGTLGIICNNKDKLDSIFNFIKESLNSRKDYLPPAAQSIRRAYKKAGFVPRIKQFFAEWYFTQWKNSEGKRIDMLAYAVELRYSPAYSHFISYMKKYWSPPSSSFPIPELSDSEEIQAYTWLGIYYRDLSGNRLNEPDKSKTTKWFNFARQLKAIQSSATPQDDERDTRDISQPFDGSQFDEPEPLRLQLKMASLKAAIQQLGDGSEKAKVLQKTLLSHLTAINSKLIHFPYDKKALADLHNLEVRLGLDFQTVYPKHSKLQFNPDDYMPLPSDEKHLYYEKYGMQYHIGTASPANHNCLIDSLLQLIALPGAEYIAERKLKADQIRAQLITEQLTKPMELLYTYYHGPRILELLGINPAQYTIETYWTHNGALQPEEVVGSGDNRILRLWNSGNHYQPIFRAQSFTLPDGRNISFRHVSMANFDNRCGFKVLLGEAYFKLTGKQLSRSSVVNLLDVHVNANNETVIELITKDVRACYERYSDRQPLLDLPDTMQQQFQQFKLRFKQADRNYYQEEPIKEELEKYCKHSATLLTYLHQYLSLEKSWLFTRHSFIAFATLCGIRLHCVDEKFLSKNKLINYRETSLELPAPAYEQEPTQINFNINYKQEVFIMKNYYTDHFDKIITE